MPRDMRGNGVMNAVMVCRWEIASVLFDAGAKSEEDAILEEKRCLLPPTYASPCCNIHSRFIALRSLNGP
jgi:hypothetical protein